MVERRSSLAVGGEVQEGINMIEYSIIQKARSKYLDGHNITDFLKTELGDNCNTSEIIELAYDIQTGSYTKYALENQERFLQYGYTLANGLNEILEENSTLLDIGSGELTTLSFVYNQLQFKPQKIIASDLSWSRLKEGSHFFSEHAKDVSSKVELICANMSFLPYPSKSIDVVTSSHALEPNGAILTDILRELFRVTKRYLVLYEPSYEKNSAEGRERMDRLGYIKNIEQTVETLGGKLVDFSLLEKPDNPLNPTAKYVIIPQNAMTEIGSKQSNFTAPGTNYPLIKRENFWVSEELGLAYPVLENIPLLRRSKGILATVKS